MGWKWKLKSAAKGQQSKLVDLLDLKGYHHRLSVNDLCETLQTDRTKGLTTEAAKANQEQYGENILSPPKGLNPVRRFLVHNFQGADCIAFIGIIIFLVNYLTETFSNEMVEPDIEKIYVALTLSLFVNFVGVYSYIIEWKTVRILERIRQTVGKTNCWVIRDGQKSMVDAKELTVGDLVEIHCGDRIPADIRVIETFNFQVDNSFILADSPAPIVSKVEATSKTPLRSANLIFAATFAVSGKCRGIVLKVGDSALIGSLERESTLLKAMVYTPLIYGFNKIVLLYCIIAGVLSFVFTFLVMYLNYKFLDVSTVYIAIFIAMVPEKLLICLLTNHILATSRMENQGSLVKHFEGIETLGWCSVICCGKSGIITEDSAQVSRVWFGGNIFDIATLSNDQIKSEAFGILARSMHLNVSQHLIINATLDSESIPDQVELAIVQYLKSVGSLQESQCVYEVVFSSEKMYQLSIHSVDYDPRFLLVAMGVPETILKNCSTILMDGVELKLDKGMRNEVQKVIKEITETGDQVIGFCEIFLPASKFPKDSTAFDKIGIPTRRFRFVGIVSFKNPIRPSAKDSVALCRGAGIKVVLLSRDSITTTEKIARSVGIISEDAVVHDANYVLESLFIEKKPADVAIMVTGEVLETLTEAEIKYLLFNYNEIMFARIRPHQKLEIVQSFQENGEVVAFTGKTFDDSGALKKANIGLVPMDASCDFAKHTADIILRDGSITCIVKSIQEGRLVFENFRKSICYELTTNLPKLVPFFLYMILRIPLPLGAISILVIDIGIDFLAAIALSYEKAEPHLMQTPSKKDENIISKKMILRSYFHIGILETCAGMLLYFAVLSSNGFLPSRLIGLRNDWLDPGNDGVQDSFGQEWSYEQRKKLEAGAHMAYLYAIAITQIANLISSRTNRSSLFQVKTNWILLVTIAIELALASLLASLNLGWLDESLKLREIRWIRVLLILPFALFIIIYDELRKCVIRRFTKSWVAQQLQYM